MRKNMKQPARVSNWSTRRDSKISNKSSNVIILVQTWINWMRVHACFDFGFRLSCRFILLFVLYLNIFWLIHGSFYAMLSFCGFFHVFVVPLNEFTRSKIVVYFRALITHQLETFLWENSSRKSFSSSSLVTRVRYERARDAILVGFNRLISNIIQFNSVLISTWTIQIVKKIFFYVKIVVL